MRCQSAGEIGCLEVSAGFSFPHLYRSPDFDGRPRFATMMQFPCPRFSCPYSPIFLINARERGHKILWLRTNTLRRKRCTNLPLANVVNMDRFTRNNNALALATNSEVGTYLLRRADRHRRKR